MSLLFFYLTFSFRAGQDETLYVAKKSVNKVLYNESIDEAIGNFVDIGTQREIG